MNRLVVSDITQLFLDNFAGSLIDLWVHGRIFLNGSLHLLIFDLLGDLSNEVVLVLKELIQVTLLIALFN
jgi:hypothetical protein